MKNLVIFRNYQQNAEEIYDFIYFKQEHVAFFDRTTFHQLEDAASAVLAGQNQLLFSELFSVELKFTIDTLNSWFSNIINSKFLELNDIKKQIFVQGNPIIPSETTCSVFGFLLYVQAAGKH